MAEDKGIILLSQNLFFQGRVETAAEPLGYQVRQARTEADFWTLWALWDGNGDGGTALALALVDLEGDADTWAAVLTGLQRRTAGDAGSSPGAEVRIVAFGPHEDTASMERAKELGCPLTLNKGRFSATLGDIIAGR